MLEGYGIHTLIWDAADDRLGDFLVASPADATGRGIELHVRQGGHAADLTGAGVYLVWRHRRTGTRGCEPMAAIDASLGQFLVYYPAAMCQAEGMVDAQCMVSWGERSISTRHFVVQVEPVLVGGEESEDGFTLFVETIKRYEGAIEVTTDAAEAATEAARLADVARNNLMQAAQRHLRRPHRLRSALGCRVHGGGLGRRAHGERPLRDQEVRRRRHIGARRPERGELLLSMGTIATSILTDIANAIRFQAGVATTYKPRQMAAAILDLDGTDAGGYVPQQYKQVESGVLSSGVLDDMADAIRIQNGTQTQYAPSDMAQAILDLTWDVGLKVRAMLLTDGTLEFNYRSGRSSDLGTISKCWEVDPAGYSSAAARPWDSDRMGVTRVAFDSDFSGAGMTNFGYFFHSMQNLVEVSGFEELSGATNVSQLFTSCTALETVWATSFDGSAITSATYPFNGCARLVGQTGFVPSNSTGKTALSFGASGVLTNPANDQRTWAWAHLYERGVLEITSAQAPDSQRQALASGRVCTNAHYQSHAAMPWYAQRMSVYECEFLADLSGTTIASLGYWFSGDTGLTEVTGWANVDGLASMRQTFNGCTSLALLDLTGLDPSALTDYFYSFAGCTALVTIFVDSTWALASGASGMGSFYNCTRILGGNGTAYSSSAYGYARMVIDRAGQVGYLTEA